MAVEIGETYGRWRVLSYEGRNNLEKNLWKCECTCGTIRVVVQGNLVTGESRSCGCLKIESNISRTTHGMTEHPAYWVYHAAKGRCERETDARYSDYGGRGIKFLFESFEKFWELLGQTYKPGLTLERINNDANYEPGNVKWATYLEQAANKRRYGSSKG